MSQISEGTELISLSKLYVAFGPAKSDQDKIAIRFCLRYRIMVGKRENEGMSGRWWRRRIRHNQWFNDLSSETQKIEKDFDDIIHRVFRNPTDEETTRGRHSIQHADEPLSQPSSSRIGEFDDPLVDVFVDEDYVVVVVELLGVDRNSIDFHATENKLIFSVDLLGHRYSREIDLPARVDAKLPTSTLKNGVLEVRLRKLPEKLVIR